MSDDRAAVYLEDGKAVYRASSVGLCEEALVAIRTGITPTLPPDWFMEKLEEGTQWEGFIVSQAMTQHGLTLISTQDEIEVEVGSSILIRGHTDGRGRTDDPTDQYGVEAKKLGPRLWSNWEKGMDYFFAHSPYYRDQLTLYMHEQGIPFVYAAGRWDPDKGEVVEVETRIITEPPGDINVIKAKVMRVEARARRGEIGTCDGSVSWPCPVYFLHMEEEREAVDDGALEALAHTYREAVDAEKMAKQAKETAQEKLVEAMTAAGHEKIQVNGFKLSRYVHTSRWLDRKKVEAAGLDPTEFMSESSKDRVRVTAPKKESE